MPRVYLSIFFSAFFYFFCLNCWCCDDLIKGIGKELLRLFVSLHQRNCTDGVWETFWARASLDAKSKTRNFLPSELHMLHIHRTEWKKNESMTWNNSCSIWQPIVWLSASDRAWCLHYLAKTVINSFVFYTKHFTPIRCGNGEENGD